MKRLSLALPLLLLGGFPMAADLPATIRQVKPSIVGIGTFLPLRQQQDQLRGTGFVTGGGNHAVTNSHVVPNDLDEDRRETVTVYIPAAGNQAERRPAKVIKRDPAHDLCLLRFEGPAVSALRLGRSADVVEGETYAFTGFPILNALGLHPVTHRGIVSAISPVIRPLESTKDLSPDLLKRVIKPFDIFQLDATAYPGNSGSPLYQIGSGRVVGIINSVFVQGTKERAITDPSGISYAIPVDYVRDLLGSAGLKY